MKDPVTSSLSRQAVWVVGGRCIGIGATFASSVLAARLLGPAEYGVFLLLTTLLALGAMLAMVGLNEAGLRFVAEALGRGREDVAKQYVVRALLIAVAGSAIVAPLLGVVSVFIAGHRPADSLLIALLVPLGIVGLVWQKLGTELTRAYGDLRWVSFLSGGQTGGPLSNVAFMLGLAAIAMGVLAADAPTALALLVLSVALTAPFVAGILSKAVANAGTGNDAAADAPLPAEASSGLFTVTAFIFANQLLAFAAQQVDLWLAGAFLTSEAVGLFGAAKRAILVVAMPVQMATMTIVGVIPRLYAMNRPDELERVVRGAATASGVPSLLALAAILMLPALSLRVVFGEVYVAAAAPLVVLALGQAVLVLSGNPQHLLTMTGRHRVVFAINLAASFILIGGGSAAAQRLGATGLAAASAASLAFQNGALWWVARRELGIWTHPSFAGLLAACARRLGWLKSGGDEPEPDTLSSARVSPTSAG